MLVFGGAVFARFLGFVGGAFWGVLGFGCCWLLGSFVGFDLLLAGALVAHWFLGVLCLRGDWGLLGVCGRALVWFWLVALQRLLTRRCKITCL